MLVDRVRLRTGNWHVFGLFDWDGDLKTKKLNFKNSKIKKFSQEAEEEVESACDRPSVRHPTAGRPGTFSCRRQWRPDRGEDRRRRGEHCLTSFSFTVNL